MLKKIGIVLGILIIVVAAFLFWYLDKDTKDKYEAVSFDESLIPQYDRLTVPFTNSYDAKNSLPLIGSAVIDIDNDGVEELFVGGGKGQKDAMLRYIDGEFVDITDEVEWHKEASHTSYGAAVIDMNNDGNADIIIARDDAVYYYENKGGVFAEPLDLGLQFNDRSQPVAITLSDINMDGAVDVFVSAYLKKDMMEGQTIFNKVGYGATSEMFLNNGDNTFKKITKSSGLEYIHNTFCAVFVDLDNDRDADLVVAHDTGEPRIWKNNGNLTFSLVKQPLTGVFSYPMGIAVGDYDNNGYQDLFFSNVGSSLPEFMVRGDLKKDQTLVTDWILLSNQGNMKFEDKAEQTKVAKYEFSWGAVFEDFNLDGLQDLVVSENYVDLPNSKVRPLPSRFLMQLPDHTFTNIEDDNNTINPCNGITPVVADFNKDGFPDLVHINLDGDVKVFISKANVKSNYVAIKLPETTKYLNASVTVERMDGTKLTQHRLSGEGLCSDQTHTLFFGLGDAEGIKSCVLMTMDGESHLINIPTVNTTISF